MKRASILIAFALVCFAGQLMGQCTPNPIYQDSSVGVYPPPISAETPNGGINIPACVNEPYAFTLTFKVPPTFEFGGTELELFSVTVPTTGAVSPLPEGLTYACNPPSCEFTPDGGLGCLIIQGTPTANNEIKEYDLMITDVVIDNTIGPLTFNFPNEIIPGADGQYLLDLREQGNCVTSTENVLETFVQVSMAPNPATDWTNLTINSDIEGTFQLEVNNFTGQRIANREIRLIQGENRFELNTAEYAEGLYHVTIQNNEGAISKKLLIVR